MTSYVVTRWYRAPELLAGATVYDGAVDMWSVGCILGEMLGRKALFRGRSHAEQLQLIVSSIGVSGLSAFTTADTTARTTSRASRSSRAGAGAGGGGGGGGGGQGQRRRRPLLPTPPPPQQRPRASPPQLHPPPRRRSGCARCRRTSSSRAQPPRMGGSQSFATGRQCTQLPTRTPWSEWPIPRRQSDWGDVLCSTPEPVFPSPITPTACCPSCSCLSRTPA